MEKLKTLFKLFVCCFLCIPAKHPAKMFQVCVFPSNPLVLFVLLS